MNIKKLLFIFFSMALLAAIPYAAFAADDDFMWQDEDETAYTAPAAKKSVSNKKKTKAMSANASKSAKKRLNKKNKRNNTALNDDAASEKSVLSNKNKPAAQTAKIKKSRKKTSDEIDQLPLPPPPKKKNKEDSLLPSKDKKENSGTEKKTESSSSEPGEPDYEAWDREYQEALAAEEAKKKQEQAVEEDSEPRELNYKMLSGWETDSRDGRGAAFSMKKNSASFVVNEKKESCDSKLILKEVNAEHKKFKQRDRPSKVKAYAIKNGVSGYYFNIDDDRSKHYFAFICAGSKTLSITLKNAESDSVFQEAMKSLQMDKISSKNKKNAEKPTLKPVVYMTDILVR